MSKEKSNRLIHSRLSDVLDAIKNILQTELIPLQSDIHTVLQQYPL
jgi:hypothetical protein